jgi:tRNA A37 threonylcarbamoyltransferase TsaD
VAEEDHLIAFLMKHQNEIIDWINENIKTQFTPTGNMFDRLANQVNRQYPYGKQIEVFSIGVGFAAVKP